MELTESFVALLQVFAPVFTAPSMATFQLLMSGWILSTRHRYVTDLIVSSDSVDHGHFSDYHRFFSHAAWDIDRLWRLLAQLALRTLFGPDAVLLLAADDTLCRKRGLSLFGVGMHHDPLISSRAMKLVSWGHDWVTLYLVVVNPWWAPTKVFALPILMRLYRNRQGLTKGQKRQPRQSRRGSGRKMSQRKSAKASSTAKSPHKTRPQLLSEMLALLAGWFPERKFLLVVDSLYSGQSVLRFLPPNVDLIGPVHPQGALYAPAPPVIETRRGKPRMKGDKLSSREEWAADGTPWQTLVFDQYGLHATLEVKERTGLYYKAGRDRLLKFVLSRDAEGDRPTQIYYCTNLALTAEEVLSLFSRRWSCEVTHHDAKQYLGFEDPANRAPQAVQRTAPMAMFLYTLTVIWYATTGHRHVRFPKRPWYTRKSEPSFADMLTTLRRLSWENKLSKVPADGTRANNPIALLTYLATLVG